MPRRLCLDHPGLRPQVMQRGIPRRTVFEPREERNATLSRWGLAGRPRGFDRLGPVVENLVRNVTSMVQDHLSQRPPRGAFSSV